MKRYGIQVARVILCIALIAVVDSDRVHVALLWIVLAPWVVLCFFGIICALPILMIVIGAGAMGQGDWTGPALDSVLFFINPTLFSMVISEVVRKRKRNRNPQQSHPPPASGASDG